jgi:NAD(P)H-nitrite reductase large subunit
VLVGGREGENVRLGEVIAQFVSEDTALKLGKRCLKLTKARKTTVAAIIDELGIEQFKKLVTG